MRKIPESHFKALRAIKKRDSYRVYTQMLKVGKKRWWEANRHKDRDGWRKYLGEALFNEMIEDFKEFEND